MLAAVGLVFATLAIAGPTAAPDPIAIRIAWDAPSACPAAASVAADLSALTHGAIAATVAVEGEVRARVVEEAAGFTLELEIVSGDRSEIRHLTSDRCETLARAAALMIAVAVDPVATATTVSVDADVVPPPIEPSDEPARQPPAPVGTAPAPPRSDAPRIRWTHRAVIAAWVGPDIATLPRVSAIVGGDIGWRFGPIGLQLSGWHSFVSTEAIAPGVAVRASLSGGGVRFVYAPRVGPIELPIGLGLELGALIGGGTGERVRDRNARALWAAVAAGVGVVWPARSRIALAVRADALVPVLRPGIHLERGDARILAFRSPPVGFRVLAGPMVRLP